MAFRTTGQGTDVRILPLLSAKYTYSKHAPQHQVNNHRWLCGCLSLSGLLHRTLQTGALYATAIYFSLSWRLEVGDRGAGRCSAWWEPASCFTDAVCPLSSHGGRQEGLSGPSFIRARVPFMGAPQDAVASHRPPLQMPAHWGLEFST